MVVGIGFYKREQWQQLLDTAADADILEKTYDEWMDVLDSSLEKIPAYGIEPELVEVDVDELLAFCKERDLRNNAETRAKFIAKVAAAKANEKTVE